MNRFAWVLVATVPVLYALFWWLDYRWQALHREAGEPPPFRPAEGDD